MPERPMAAASGAWVRPLGFAEATQVALNMREADAREIFACRFDRDDPAGRSTLALEVSAAVASRGLGWVAGTERPVAVFGAVEHWPGHWGGFQFATDAWPRVMGAVTRFVRQAARPALLARGARRVEVRSAGWRSDAHRWLAALGAEAEARHPAHGRDGADYLTFAWIAAARQGPDAPGACTRRPEER